MQGPPTETAASVIRRRALTGAALVVARGLIVRVLGFASYVVIARFVSPAELGVFTLGASIVMAGQFFADAGMAAALVRRPEEPTRADLRAVQGLQLAVSGVFAGVGFAVGAIVGGDGLVIGAMVLSLPIATLRVPAVTLLERRLEYKPLVSVEVAETLAYTIFVIVAVVAGAGVWGLGLAVIVRAIVGTLAMTRVGPVGFVAPSFDLARVRPVLRFGATFQALGAVNVANEQIFNPAVTAISGLGMLGIWGLAYRVLQLPQLVFVSLRRVSYPAMARLIGAGEDLRATVERTARLAAVTSGFVLVPLAASASAAVPLLFGERWSAAADVVPGLCLGLMIGGPVSVAVAAYLLAAGHAGVVLRSALMRMTAMLLVSLGLLPLLGAVALGLGYVAGSTVEALVLGRATERALGVRLARTLLPTYVRAIAAGAVGLAVARAADDGVWTLMLSAGLSFALFAGAVWMQDRAVLREAARLMRQLFSRRLGAPA